MCDNCLICQDYKNGLGQMTDKTINLASDKSIFIIIVIINV